VELLFKKVYVFIQSESQIYGNFDCVKLTIFSSIPKNRVLPRSKAKKRFGQKQSPFLL